MRYYWLAYAVKESSEDCFHHSFLMCDDRALHGHVTVTTSVSVK